MNKTIWKLGCNLGKGKPSFYKFINDYKIVIGVHDKRYSIGDYILITEGFTAKAIVKITSTYRPVTQKQEFRSKFKEFQIDFENWVEFYQCEWYELTENEVFEYKQEKGIVRIQKEEIKNKIIEVTKFEFNKMVKTVYFTGTNTRTDLLEQAIKTATDKRDIFIKENIENIGKIENEDIIFLPWGGNNANVLVTIKLTYYPK